MTITVLYIQALGLPDEVLRLRCAPLRMTETGCPPLSMTIVGAEGDARDDYYGDRQLRTAVRYSIVAVGHQPLIAGLEQFVAVNIL